MSEVAAPAPEQDAPTAFAAESRAQAAPDQPMAAPLGLRVRIEPTGPAAERGVATVCADGTAVRDPGAQLGSPAAIGVCDDGAAAVALLVRAATLALDDTDLHITLQRP